MNRSQRVRTIIATVLLVVGGFGVAAASTGWWLERNFLDTDRFTGTANNVLDEEDTQTALTHVVVRQLSSAAGRDLELAEPFLAAVVRQVVDSAPFRAIFDRALAGAHELLVDRDADEIVLDLTATYDSIKEPLDQVAPTLAEQLPSREQLKVVVLRESQLTAAWDVIDLVEEVIAIVTVAAFVLLAAGLALAYQRWRALALAAWILVGTLAAVLLALVVAGRVIPDRIADPVYARSAKTGFGVITHGLVVQTIVLAILGGVVALAAGWTQRHGLAAWAGAFRRAWRRLEELMPRPAETPAPEAPAGATASAGGAARVAGTAHAEIGGALDRVLPGRGARAQHAGRALALLAVGLFAVLAPGGLTTVVVVLLGVGALYLAVVEGVAAWRAPKSPAQEAGR